MANVDPSLTVSRLLNRSSTFFLAHFDYIYIDYIYAVQLLSRETTIIPDLVKIYSPSLLGSRVKLYTVF